MLFVVLWLGCLSFVGYVLWVNDFKSYTVDECFEVIVAAACFYVFRWLTCWSYWVNVFCFLSLFLIGV